MAMAKMFVKHRFPFGDISFSYRLLLLFTVTILGVMCSPCEGRSFPRFSTGSVRFPDESIAEKVGDSVGDSIRRKGASTIPKGSLELVSYGQSRKASIPASALPSSSHDNDAELSDEDTSAEIIDASSNSGEDRGPEEHRVSAKDEELRKLLCPHPISTNNRSLDITIPDGDKSTSIRGNVKGSPSTNPRSEDLLLRYDLQMGKCAEIGKRGHCGENMIFEAEMDSGAYGYCECDFENRIQRGGKGKVDPEQSTETTTSGESTPLVFHPGTKSCYHLYEQAYCKEDEWLVLNRELKGPSCEPRKCPSVHGIPESSMSPNADFTKSNGTSKSRGRSSKLLTPSLWTNNTVPKVSGLNDKEDASPTSQHSETGAGLWVPLNGNGPCVRLNKQNNEYCAAEELVIFNVGDIVPKCAGRQFRAIIRNACPPGSFYSIIGRCQPDWDF